MNGPGVYVPDITEGITRIEDLPKPRLEHRSCNYSCRRLPLLWWSRRPLENRLPNRS
jgi:hypothetical protein